jgi:hypothetical protein
VQLGKTSRARAGGRRLAMERGVLGAHLEGLHVSPQRRGQRLHARRVLHVRQGHQVKIEACREAQGPAAEDAPVTGHAPCKASSPAARGRGAGRGGGQRAGQGAGLQLAVRRRRRKVAWLECCWRVAVRRPSPRPTARLPQRVRPGHPRHPPRCPAHRTPPAASPRTLRPAHHESRCASRVLRKQASPVLVRARAGRRRRMPQARMQLRTTQPCAHPKGAPVSLPCAKVATPRRSVRCAVSRPLGPKWRLVDSRLTC